MITKRLQNRFYCKKSEVIDKNASECNMFKKTIVYVFSNGNETKRRIFDLIHEWALDVMANMQIPSHENDIK